MDRALIWAIAKGQFKSSIDSGWPNVEHSDRSSPEPYAVAALERYRPGSLSSNPSAAWFVPGLRLPHPRCVGHRLALWAEQVKDNEKNRQNYAEQNYEERSEIH